MSTLDRVIAYAREQYGPTAATFDRDYGAGAPAAEQWVRNGCWRVANGTDESSSVDERQARADQLHRQLATDLERFRDECQRREYVGWSRWSPGPVRYADEERPEREVDVESVSGYPPDQD